MNPATLARLALICLLFAGSAAAQNTSVSGQIIDSSGQAWKAGTFQFTFVPLLSNPTAVLKQNGSPSRSESRSFISWRA